jgi:hypothetical protein
MNHYRSTIESEWHEIVEVATPEENSLVEVAEPKLSELHSIYQSVKPTIEEGSTYEFIGMNCSQDGVKSWGILNCRINGEHIQIRF